MGLSATVVITTKNRREELASAIKSALKQSCLPEVLVIDDGSTDGTAAMVRNEFPTVRLEHSEVSRGLIVQRNRAAQLASGDIIFSIDDDAEFTSAYIVDQTLKDFDDPRIGAVTIPYFEPRKEKKLRQSAPDSRYVWVTNTFIGTAHALRRDVFLGLGGYRESLFHQGEEGDFAVRLLDAGYVVRLGRAESIKHWESPKRDFRRMDYYGPRNSILFAWQNAPFICLPGNLLATTFNCLRLTFEPARLWTRTCGVIGGYRDCFNVKRQPVRWQTFRLWRELRKCGPQSFEQIVPQLQPTKDIGVVSG